jgi:hypothetical protein
MRNNHHPDNIPIRSAAWSLVFSLPLIATGYAAGAISNLWLLGTGAWVMFSISVMLSMAGPQ